jgi:hypothetical protein
MPLKASESWTVQDINYTISLRSCLMTVFSRSMYLRYCIVFQEPPSVLVGPVRSRTYDWTLLVNDRIKPSQFWPGPTKTDYGPEWRNEQLIWLNAIDRRFLTCIRINCFQMHSNVLPPSEPSRPYPPQSPPISLLWFFKSSQEVSPLFYMSQPVSCDHFTYKAASWHPSRHNGVSSFT